MDLGEVCARITPPDEAARIWARRRWDALAKPLGGLGLLETAITDIAALTGDGAITLRPRTAVVLCADNGVTARGVAQADSAVTGIVARELAQGRTAVCRMAAAADCRVLPVDMGISYVSSGSGAAALGRREGRAGNAFSGLLDRRIGNGTADFTQGPAMSREAAERAVLTGVELVRRERERGTRLLAAGEMGIGNTTTASAIASVLLGRAPEEVTGRGAGLSGAGLARKLAAIREGIARNRPEASDPLDVLAKVGGYDLAGLCGLYLGGALYGVPVLIDGFPSGVAALCAARLCPLSKKAMIASHVSAEPAGAMVLQALEKHPLICAEMRLGEGTGAVAAIPLFDMALSVYQEAYTFQEGGIPAYVPQM